MTAQQEMLQLCLEEMEREGISVDQCLSRHAEAAPSLLPLLAVAERYRRAPEVGPSVAFQSAARERMLNLMAATNDPAIPAAPPAFPWWRSRALSLFLRVAAALLALLLVEAGGSVAVLAAPPDSLLYPAKLAVEETRVRLAGSAEERAGLRLELMDRRAVELRDMAGSASPAAVGRAVERWERSVEEALIAVRGEGGDGAAALHLLVGSLADEEQILVDISGRLGDGAGGERATLEDAILFLERERTEVRRLLGEDEPAGGDLGPETREEDPSPRLWVPTIPAEIPTETPTPGAAAGNAGEGRVATVEPEHAGESQAGINPTAGPGRSEAGAQQDTVDAAPSVTPTAVPPSPTPASTSQTSPEPGGSGPQIGSTPVASVSPVATSTVGGMQGGSPAPGPALQMTATPRPAATPQPASTPAQPSLRTPSGGTGGGGSTAPSSRSGGGR